MSWKIIKSCKSVAFKGFFRLLELFKGLWQKTYVAIKIPFTFVNKPTTVFFSKLISSLKFRPLPVYFPWNTQVSHPNQINIQQESQEHWIGNYEVQGSSLTLNKRIDWLGFIATVKLTRIFNLSARIFRWWGEEVGPRGGGSASCLSFPQVRHLTAF